MNPITKKRLERFAQFVEQIPRRAFDMGMWARFEDDAPNDATVNKDNVGECGTACCLAGWESLRRGKTLDRWGDLVNLKPGEPGSALYFARNSLGLSSSDADKLFYPGGWPSKTDQKTGAYKPMFRSTPKGAAARIRHLIKTGE